MPSGDSDALASASRSATRPQPSLVPGADLPARFSGLDHHDVDVPAEQRGDALASARKRYVGPARAGGLLQQLPHDVVAARVRAARLLELAGVLLRRLDELGKRLERRSEEHTSELQSPCNLVCRLLLEKKKNNHTTLRIQLQDPLKRHLRTQDHDRHIFDDYYAAPLSITQSVQYSRVGHYIQGSGKSDV